MSVEVNRPLGLNSSEIAGRQLRVLNSQIPERHDAQVAFELEETPPEHCGIVLIIPKERKKLLDTLYLAGSGLAHRGSDDGIGMATISDNGLKIIHADGTYQGALAPTVSSETKFNGNVVIETLKRVSIRPDLDQPSHLWILHLRYGTHGDWADNNLQPSLEFATDGTEISISHNGEYPGANKIRANLREEVSENASDTILITKLLRQEIGDGAKIGIPLKENWDRAFQRVYDENPGAASQLTLLRDPKTGYWAAYISRDKDGIRPLIEGVTAEGDKMFASETVAFDVISGSSERSLRAGEIIKIDSRGVRTDVRRGQEEQNPSEIELEPLVNRLCVIENIYFGRPDSLEPNPYRPPSEWRSYGGIRESIGRRLAELYPLELDFIVGVPRSGLPYAEGYAAQIGDEYRQVIVQDLNMRVFLKDRNREAMRALAKSKFKIDRRDGIEGASLGVFDDTLVRGTESPEFIQALRNAGASEVNLFIGYSPYNHPCHLGMSTRGYQELAGYRHNLDPFKPDTRALAKEIGADRLFYLPPIDLLELTSLPGQELVLPEDPLELFLANNQCGACITGRYPVGKDGQRHSAMSPTVVFDPSRLQRVGQPTEPQFVHVK